MSLPIEQGGRLNVGGITWIARDFIIRPADTTAYAALDQVAATTTAANNRNLVFQVSNIDGGSGTIVAASLIDSTAESTKPQIDLILFDSIVTNAADNAAVAVTDAECERALPSGVIVFDGVTYFKTVGANGVILASNLAIPFVCKPGTKNIYGVAQARNAYTPVSAEKFVFVLGILLD